MASRGFQGACCYLDPCAKLNETDELVGHTIKLAKLRCISSSTKQALRNEHSLALAGFRRQS